MTANRQLILPQGQRLATGHPQLPLDQIQPSDHLGHRMLDLQPGIHFHEVEIARGIDDEFDRSGTHIVHCARGGHRSLSHGPPPRFIETGCRGFFDHLLMAPLHRAVAFEQVNRIALSVGKDLDFDVPGLARIALDQDRVVAETGGCLAAAGCEIRLELGVLPNNTHALAATPGTGFDQQRVTDSFGFLRKQRITLVCAVVAGNQRHAGLRHQAL